MEIEKYIQKYYYTFLVLTIFPPKVITKIHKFIYEYDFLLLTNPTVIFQKSTNQNYR